MKSSDFGPNTYAEKMAFVGEKWWNLRSFDNVLLGSPSFENYRLSSGQVLQIVTKTATQTFRLFDSIEEYRENKQARHAVTIDPESGRPFNY
jgi:hypothetical protein